MHPSACSNQVGIVRQLLLIANGTHLAVIQEEETILHFLSSYLQAVQVYIMWLDASVPTPQIQLVAVKRVFVKADSLLQVTWTLFTINQSLHQHWK